MKYGGTKKQKIILISCIAAGLCLAGIVAAAVAAAKKNPLAKGLMELAEEVKALEAEMGEGFWADALNQISCESMQAEYSLNIGGIQALENITVGMDGKTSRDMEQKLFDSKVDISIANAKLAKVSLLGTEDMLYLQLPTVWDGSVVVNAEDIGGQWDGSALKKELQLLTGQELGMDRRVDIDFFEEIYVNHFSVSRYMTENAEAFRTLYENMEVLEVGKAEKEGKLGAEQVSILKGEGSGEDLLWEELKSQPVQDALGEPIETTCYLVILPEGEMKELFRDTVGDIRLYVYLDSDKRIVRICSLPGESFTTNLWEGGFALSLTGTEHVTDRVELAVTGQIDMTELYAGFQETWDSLGGFADSAGTGESLTALQETAAIAGDIVIEKDDTAPGSYRISCDGSLEQQEYLREISFECGIKGECLEAEGEPEKQGSRAARLSLEVENFVLRSEEGVLCRGSGEAVFSPLGEEIQVPRGKEYRIAEMNELDTALFLAECTKKVYENYSGYLRLMR